MPVRLPISTNIRLMENTMENLKLEDISKLEYIPLNSLIELYQNIMPVYYQHRFSLKPFVDSIRNEMGASCGDSYAGFISPLIKYVDLEGHNGQDNASVIESEDFRTLIKILIPSLRNKNTIGFLSVPFAFSSYFLTERLKELFDDSSWQIRINHERIQHDTTSGSENINVFILNKHYGQKLVPPNVNTIELFNVKTGITKFYQLNFNYEFVETEINGNLPNLSESEIQMLINNIDKPEIWNSYFPPSLISFTGFAICIWNDVTEIESIARLRNLVHSYKLDAVGEGFMDEFYKYTRAILDEPEIELGLLLLDEKNPDYNKPSSITNKTGADFIRNYMRGELVKDIYSEMMDSLELTLLERVPTDSESEMEQELHKQGIRSLLLYPLVEEGNKISVIIEFASRKESFFTPFSVQRLSKVLEVLKEGYYRFSWYYENIITSIIQSKFTSIHSSIEWKFKELAGNFLIESRNNKEAEIAPVVFEDLTPLYGQADIVSSSTIRNKCIQADLLLNAELVLAVMEQWHKRIKLHALEKLILETKKAKQKVAVNYDSTDESRVIQLLTDKIHPYLAKLNERYDVPKKSYKQYLKQLDPALDIVYEERRKFEDSVTKLNTTISSFLEEENQKLQNVLPHYFEKYKTDGVEYNIYLGQSLLEEGCVEAFDISEFRLWQLTNMCEIVRLVDKLGPKLEISLTTAQLIFVYNNPLSIRFRMDEKKFDVDGTYNVRYEILKKRIDKATIKGTDERLTVSGKIAIVYLSENDKNEYLEYIDYLISKKYITKEIEDLELNKLQGAEGLRALRVKVN